jgi:2-methylisocitrate lyase-like PEP mutase family enzyme
MSTATSLRELLGSPGMVIAPGAYDAIGARLIEQAGFAAVYMTGAGTSPHAAFPTSAFCSMSEMVDNAAVMARATHIPLIADADTGYGNELNVTRTVREYEARGVAAIHIEDQVSPKRCGHLEGKEVISRDEFVSKIRAAVEARRSKEFVVIARTDARAMLGLDEAIWRANASLEAGADMAFVEATQKLEEIAQVPKQVRGPCLLNVVPGGRTPIIDLREVERMGYKLAILPGLMLKAAIEAGDAALAELKATHLAAKGHAERCADLPSLRRRRVGCRFAPDSTPARPWKAGERHGREDSVRQVVGRTRRSRPGRWLGAAAHRSPSAARSVRSPGAGEVAARGLPLHNPELVFSTPDHAVSSQPGRMASPSRSAESCMAHSRREAPRWACACSTWASRAKASCT